MENAFTIFDVMERKGYFRSNPANVNSRLANGLPAYKKQLFPKMVYHPKGEQRITNPAEVIATPLGPKRVGEQRELIWKIAEDQEAYSALKAEGWHDTPTDAIAARGGPDAILSPMEVELEELRRVVADQKARLEAVEA